MKVEKSFTHGRDFLVHRKCQNCGSYFHADLLSCPNCGEKRTYKRDSVRASDVQKHVFRDRGDQMRFELYWRALPTFVIGAIIIIVGVSFLYGLVMTVLMEARGENFGEGMGKWGESVGRFYAIWRTNADRQDVAFGAFYLIAIGYGLTLGARKMIGQRNGRES